MQKIYKKQFDGLRFVLFFGIFIYHNFVQEFWYLGHCVSAFFVLSGYLITNLLLESDGVDNCKALKYFYIRRFLRILPAYYLLVISLILMDKLPYAGWHLTYLSNMKLFIMSLTGEMTELHAHWQSSGMHFWSLCIEEQYYLIYPITLLFTPEKWRMKLFGGLIAFSILLRFYFYKVIPNAYYGALLPISGEYLLWGGFLCYLDRRNKLKNISPVALFYTGLLSLAALSFALSKTSVVPQFHATPSQTLWAVAITLVVYGLWKEDSLWAAKILSIRPFVYLGKISYGLYLYHLFTWQLADYLVSKFPFLEAVSFFVLRFCLTVLLAMLSWHLFEGPINQLRTKIPYRPGKDSLSTKVSHAY